jgi:catecholate siderophore receptor
VSVFNPQFTFANVGTNPTWAGLPTKVAIDTKSVYLIDTANYNDLVILNGGVRFDDYNIKVSGFGTVGGFPNIFGAQEQHYGLPNFNLGLTA